MSAHGCAAPLLCCTSSFALHFERLLTRSAWSNVRHEAATSNNSAHGSDGDGTNPKSPCRRQHHRMDDEHMHGQPTRRPNLGRGLERDFYDMRMHV